MRNPALKRPTGARLTINCLSILCLGLLLESTSSADAIQWRKLPDLPNAHGVAGPFAGVHQDALIVAGGANFPDGVPWHPTPQGEKSLKTYHNVIHVLVRTDVGQRQTMSDQGQEGASGDSTAGKYEWVSVSTTLPRPLAYGVSIPTPEGVLCLGGEWQAHRRASESDEIESILLRSRDVFLLRWNPNARVVDMTRDWPQHPPRRLPQLPVGTTNACGARVGGFAYLVGGDTGEGGSQSVWRLNLAPKPRAAWNWESLPAWDGPPRSHAIACEQAGKLFLFSGRNRLDGQGFRIQRDAHCFDPHDKSWAQLADIAVPGEAPRAVMAGTGHKWGPDRILIFGGSRGDVLLEREQEFPRRIAAARSAADDSLVAQLEREANALYDNHAGFSSDILEYHVPTDTWHRRGTMPVTSPVTTTAVSWGSGVVIPSGERSPGIRTRDVWLVTPESAE